MCEGDLNIYVHIFEEFQKYNSIPKYSVTNMGKGNLRVYVHIP